MLFLSLSDKVSNGDVCGEGVKTKKEREGFDPLSYPSLSLNAAATYSPTVSQYHRRGQA